MRKAYLELPAGSLASAGTVMLDWNISARIANIHRRQLAFNSLNLDAAEMERLRGLVNDIPPGADILSAFGAAEPETRRVRTVSDVNRYNQRTDIASVYLSRAPDYLLHLLDGGESSGLVIESEPDGTPFMAEALRSWFMVSYAVLLKAVAIDRKKLFSRVERIDEFRFWLEHELGVSASREAWIGFLLLAGTGEHPGRARRLLKTDKSGDPRDYAWGATWDLMYTRIPSLLAQPLFHGPWKLPIVFVTDDSGLVDALVSTNTVVTVENAHGVNVSGDSVDMNALHEDVWPVVRSHIARQREHVMLRSRGMTTQVLRRATYLARKLEGEIGGS
ncbi:hypothetical protein [Salinibacterium sp. PAMC 21357]|uniref:hypothetical protein n=1 Tax=Salinibacterium sp. PAMC 21357 TaxID=1112215 RepID=UPI000287D353|nr:hypothetical protein [Salinibacterium sp. PAMC 21357]